MLEHRQHLLATSLKKMELTANSSLLKRKVLLPKLLPVHDGMLKNQIFCSSSEVNYSYCGFMNAVAMSCPRVLQHFSLSSSSVVVRFLYGFFISPKFELSFVLLCPTISSSLRHFSRFLVFIDTPG